MPQRNPRGTFERIADTLRQEITARRQPDEQGPRQLDTEAELSERFGVARNTLRKALSVLADEGLLYSEPTRGWFVGQAASPPTGPTHADIAAVLAHEIRAENLTVGAKFATAPEIAAKFGVSRHVARLALISLGAQGLIESRHGKGWFVRVEGTSSSQATDGANE